MTEPFEDAVMRALDVCRTVMADPAIKVDAKLAAARTVLEWAAHIVVPVERPVP